ncbi:MAG: prepilin peptidase [Nitrospirae bacterium]|nr:MAG: prepilin peptidase [Nitrospirota bacterium]
MSVYVIAFITGALIGSFLNVCIYRIPRSESIVYPASRCTSCGNPIAPWDNIPIVSYLILGGRCRHCSQRYSALYPLVETLNALLYTAVLWRFGPVWSSLVFCIFVSSLIVITFIDLEFQIIPDRITLPGIPLGLLAGALLLPDPFMRAADLGIVSSLVGLLAGGGMFYLVAVLSRGGMGGGDIKMMAMVGALTGWKAVLLTTFIGSLTGSVIGIFLMVFRGKGRKTKIPFGPFLAFGSLVTLFFGQEILMWYLYLHK